jgi:glycosyltransferase involved in cell wall biosynthesis
MRQVTDERVGTSRWTAGLLHAVRVVRWRIAERLGRALAGGRLDALETHLTHLADQLRTLTQRIEEGDHRVASLAGQLAELSGRLAEESSGATNRLAADVAALAADLAAARDERAGMRGILDRHARSIRWLAEHEPARAAVPADGPLVSVIMPVWNRAAVVGAAIDSVVAQTYRRWELLVIDDGSDDDLARVLAGYARDHRIRFIRIVHAGEGSARNRGLAESCGTIITYLDSDNTWTPGYLAAVVAGFAAHAEHDTAYAAQLVVDHQTGDYAVRAEPFDRASLRRSNFIDVNVFAHRRSVFERLGGFDEQLTRLSDWELILRYTAERDPLALDVMGGRYAFGLPDQVSQRRSLMANHYRVLRTIQPPLPVPVRVLYALWHYPQLSESYVRAEIAGLQRRGIAVEVWAESEGIAPFATRVPIHRGRLVDALARVRPDVVHTHWLAQGLACRDEVEGAGLQLTVRGHGFEFKPAVVRALAADPVVRAVFLFPHLAAQVADAGAKIHAMPACFDPDRYPPAKEKDTRLVVRVVAGIPTKAIHEMFEIARACPQHRFVLAVARANGHEGFVDQLLTRNRELGTPVEILVDLQHDAVAALVGEAGLYLHTHALLEPYGMPISIAEAMATGCHVIARGCQAAEAYVGDAGRCWDTPAEAAALIRDTATWNEERWLAAQLTAVDRAYAQFADVPVLHPLVDEFVAIASSRARAPRSPDAAPAPIPHAAQVYVQSA